MKALFTPREYARVLQLAYLGCWVLTARKGEVTPAARPYEDILQKMLKLAPTFGCADLADEKSDGSFGPSQKLEEAEPVQEAIAEFENDTFWSELVMRMSERDYAVEQAKRALIETPGVEPPPTADARLKQIEDGYWDEFEKNDLANLVLIRGGRG